MASRTENDHLRLLAVIAQGLGAKGLADYQPPEETWEEAVEDAMAEAGLAGPELPASAEERAEQVIAFVAAAGGDLG